MRRSRSLDTWRCDFRFTRVLTENEVSRLCRGRTGDFVQLSMMVVSLALARVMCDSPASKVAGTLVEAAACFVAVASAMVSPSLMLDVVRLMAESFASAIYSTRALSGSNCASVTITVPRLGASASRTNSRLPLPLSPVRARGHLQPRSWLRPTVTRGLKPR
jgi:hypothetical protein